MYQFYSFALSQKKFLAGGARGQCFVIFRKMTMAIQKSRFMTMKISLTMRKKQNQRSHNTLWITITICFSKARNPCFKVEMRPWV